MKIYAMSDIHGCFDALNKKMQQVDLSGDNKLIFLGDYIDYGKQSGQVLKYLHDLQDEYGKDKVIILKGNHEDMLIKWIDVYRKPVEDLFAFDTWLKNDAEDDYKVLCTLLTTDQIKQIELAKKQESFYRFNHKAVNMVLESNSDIIRWIRNMPLFYETDKYIFVHAGVNEKAGEKWAKSTSAMNYLYKYPAQKGSFCKTIVAGHIGTSTVANDRDYHDMYYDKESHYYIDGSVYNDGKLILFVYDDTNGKVESI